MKLSQLLTRQKLTTKIGIADLKLGYANASQSSVLCNVREVLFTHLEKQLNIQDQTSTEENKRTSRLCERKERRATNSWQPKTEMSNSEEQGRNLEPIFHRRAKAAGLTNQLHVTPAPLVHSQLKSRRLMTPIFVET